ncbi:MAG: hypothetical protein JSW60_03230 [Thermoplasmatales archaeon]|nr:MAG: hypothetical protein JSW60_03230 [Thermoplasmatales archaeon]
MMKKFGQVLLIYFFGMGMFLSAVGTITGAGPTVGDITLIPDHPAPQSIVTFSVDISGDSISSVRIIISECNKDIGLCHAPPQNVSMRNVADDTYEAKVTLEWDDVTSITYHVEIKSDGRWTAYDEHTVALSTNSVNSGSPGFEIVVFLMAIMGIVLLFKRFKSK